MVTFVVSFSFPTQSRCCQFLPGSEWVRPAFGLPRDGTRFLSVPARLFITRELVLRVITGYGFMQRSSTIWLRTPLAMNISISIGWYCVLRLIRALCHLRALNR